MSTLREQLDRLIEQKIVLQEKEKSSYKILLTNKLGDVQKKHDDITVPSVVKKPSNKPDKETQKNIDNLKANLASIEKEISGAESQLEAATIRSTSIENVKGHLKTLSRQVQVFKNYTSDDLLALALTLDDILTFKVKKEKLSQLEATTKLDIKSLNVKLGRVKLDKSTKSEKLQDGSDKSESINLTMKQLKLTKELGKITGKLTTEQKAYESYLVAKAIAEKRRKALKGLDKDTTLTTIRSIKSELKYIKESLKNDLEKKLVQITDVTNSIFDVIASKCDTYKSIYKPLRDFVDQEKEIQEKAQSILTFDVGIVCNKERFVQDFLRFIDQGRVGSFQGVTKGRERIVAMLQQRSFRTKKSVNTFLESLVDTLEFNRSNKGDDAMDIDKQLVSSVSRTELMKWLYGLEYLDVQYKVQFNGKDLNAVEFSPGERGAILLIFYLLIDKENIPLIIDQPEENLDNESVFSLLVPYIKRAKQHRQVVIVTHNPNLAVVCDAEQVICATMDKSTNEIRYTSGSIEHPRINQRIIDVLEGTMPAFSTRNDAYQKNKI